MSLTPDEEKRAAALELRLSEIDRRLQELKDERQRALAETDEEYGNYLAAFEAYYGHEQGARPLSIRAWFSAHHRLEYLNQELDQELREEGDYRTDTVAEVILLERKLAV